MKHLYLNLKRFDIPEKFGGVNRLAPAEDWGSYIAENTWKELQKLHTDEVEFVQFYPEAHLLKALEVCKGTAAVKIGCQGVFRKDTGPDGGFGAFTTERTANSMKAIGCSYVIIGHCEERRDKTEILAEAGVEDTGAVDRILNQEIRCAVKAGLEILYCIGEKAQEQDRWREVLQRQLETGLRGIDKSKVVIAYEPVWSIGPGKTPADKPYITKIARFVKEITGGMDIVYGGGLKTDNAEMLASIEEIDGGLIALTRFSGEIGFYPEEYLEIIHKYLNN